MANPNQTSLLAPDYLVIQTLQDFQGAADPDANTLIANASSISIGNSTVSTSLTSNLITTPEISVGDFNTNVSINSTAFSVTSYGGSNTYIDAYQAAFSGFVSVGTGLLINGELNANGQPGDAGQVLSSDGTIAYWSDTANNTSFVGTVSAANVVSNAQLSGNLANYVTTFNLSNNLANYAALSDPAFTGKITVNTYISVGGTSQNLVINSSSISVNGALIANSTYFKGQALTANNALYLGGIAAASYVNTSGAYTWSNTQTFENSANAIIFSNTTSNWAYWEASGIGAPTFTTRSAGTKLVLYPTIGASSVDYAIGINAATMWFSVAGVDGSFNYKWYGGNTVLATLKDNGDFLTTGGVNATSFSIGSSYIANSTQLTISNTVGVSANGILGTSGQVLTSNGSSVYWSTVSGGGGFSNGQSISVNNFVITGGFTANGSNGAAGQVLSTNGSATYWATASGITAPARQVFTANGTTNTFTVSSGYAANNLDVFLNGVKLQNGVEANVQNGSTFTILTGNPSNGAVIEVVGSQTYTSTSAGGFTNMQVFTANGTFTVPAGIVKVKVTVTGGGGGGVSSTNGGGGGGAGGTAIKIISGLTPTGTVSVTVGLGGAADASGGSSSFGAYCSATGGSTGSLQSGGSGGIGSSGDLNIKGGGGGAGTDGAISNNPTGTGGNSFWGSGGKGQGPSINTIGEAGGAYGGGGGGAQNSTGGAGASGVVVVEY